MKRHVIAFCCVMVALFAAPSFGIAAPSVPAWELGARSLPPTLAPGGTGEYRFSVRNLGEVPSPTNGTMTVELPPGVTATGFSGFLWECPGVAGATIVSCELLSGTFEFPVAPYSEVITPLQIKVAVDPQASGVALGKATMGGGGATGSTSVPFATEFAPPSGRFEVTGFSGTATNQNGTPDRQAGSHPDLTTRISFSQNAAGAIGNPKNLQVDLPPGVVGNPTAVPQCDPVLMLDPGGSQCPSESQVGTVSVDVGQGSYQDLPVFNVRPPTGSPARLAFNIYGVITNIDATVRTGGDYGVSAKLVNTSQSQPVVGSRLTLWGVPADPVHDALRAKPHSFFLGASSVAPPVPFITLPTSCLGAQTSRLTVNSWAEPDSFDHAEFSTNHLGEPFETTGCESLAFEPGLEVTPQSSPQRGAPGSIAIKLSVPQNQSPTGRSTAHLKRAVVTLPEGMHVNASSASGLASCSEAQIGLSEDGPGACPEAAKIGTVTLRTPLLDEELSGGLFLASQKQNPFGSTLAVYLALKGAGIEIKLPGKIETDPKTGRLTTIFDDNPQLPFEELTVSLKAGPRAPLTMPTTCGPATTTAVLTPWSGTEPVTLSSTFQVSADGNGAPCGPQPFAPRLNAGTASPAAGAYSPFSFQVVRGEGETEIAAISSLVLPKGLVGRLAGIPYCSGAALGSVSGAEGTGVGQIASPSCPAASQVGTVTVGAGAGPLPLYVSSGRAYLAGPYKGAPLSLAVVVPAVAGPFDLGSVVVRSALWVDPTTARITAVSDPLPTILQGIPLDLRDIRVQIDRFDFILNPTSCAPMAVESTLASTQGQTANPSSRFQVANCERLAFKPKLALSVKGPTHRNAHPAFKAVLTMPKGGANIQKAQVTLPKTELLENAHIRTICTRVQYNAGQGGGANCPPASIYGKAKAWTPLLDKPLEGPVYLRSSSHQLPDLVSSLDGQIHIDLVGRIDAKNARIRNTFESVPDAPVSRFLLEMQGGKKGLLANNTELCRTTPRATARFDGQNGKFSDSNPVMRADCGKKARKAAKTLSAKR